MVRSSHRVPHLGKRVHRPRPRVCTARRGIRLSKPRKRKEVSAGSAQVPGGGGEGFASPGCGLAHARSARPSAPGCVGRHGRSNLNFSAPDGAHARGAGRAALAPPSAGSRDAAAVPPGRSPESPLSAAWVGTLLPLNCAALAAAPALAGPLVLPSAPAALPSPSAGLADPWARCDLSPATGRGTGLPAGLSPRGLSDGSPHSLPVASSLSLGK